MSTGPEKGPDAFRTIGELAQEIGRPQHILRYWETRFSQLKPVQRAGGRRYYRAQDVALVQRIDALLRTDGFTIRGVQRLLDGEAAASAPQSAVDSLTAIRTMLRQALAADA